MPDLTRCNCGARHAPDTPCASPMGAVRGSWPMAPCPQCGQLSDAASLCATCRAVEREPQGETVRLFEPAPAQLPGQTSFGPPMAVCPNVNAWPNWHRTF